ncbi:hypothetical protein ACHWQZ_G014441 [Mnemiopsis leidyi]
MNTEIYVFFAFGILAMIINISFLTVTLLVQRGRKSAKRKKGVFKMMYITLLCSNCAMLLAPVIRYWASQRQGYSEIWCVLISYLSWISCSVNVCSILLISIDRFLAVMNPFRYVQLMKAGKVIGLQIVFMAWSFIMPQLAGSENDKERYEYIPQLNFCVPTDNKALFHAWYLISYIFPAIVAVSLNGFIMRYLLRRLSVFTERMEHRRQVTESRSGNSFTGGSPTVGKPSDSAGSFTLSKFSNNAWSMIVGRKGSRSSQYTTTQMASVNKSSQDLDIKPAKATFEMETLQLRSEEPRRSPSCCISYSGGEEISSSPLSPNFLNINPPPTLRGTPFSPGTKSEKCVRRQFNVILKTITGCVAEFVVFTLVSTAVYVISGILRMEKNPVNVVMVILVHTIVTSVLYSASYTSYYNKAVRAKARFGQQNY